MATLSARSRDSNFCDFLGCFDTLDCRDLFKLKGRDFEKIEVSYLGTLPKRGNAKTSSTSSAEKKISLYFY